MKSRSYENVRKDFNEMNRDEKLRFIIDVVTDTARSFVEKDLNKTQENLHQTARTIFKTAERVAESLKRAADNIQQTYEAEYEVVTPNQRRKSARRARTAKSGAKQRPANRNGEDKSSEATVKDAARGEEDIGPAGPFRTTSIVPRPRAASNST